QNLEAFREERMEQGQSENDCAGDFN
ncbi:hypothetical protein HDG33_007488, partial [Paraburkholderia sp. Cpub6]|nr:hypothetical protein [Paraburkholderia sp. Cpub6]MBB5463808.1 hypothetical protein [Paraburkholderia sp. Cpub6]